MTQEQDPLQEKRGNAGAARTQLLLVLLLVLAGGAAYLYLFTDIIRPRPESGQEAAIEQVKQPMPPKPQEGVQQPLTSAAKGAPQAPPAGAAPSAAVPAAPKAPVATGPAPAKPVGASPAAPAKPPVAATAPAKTLQKAAPSPQTATTKDAAQKKTAAVSPKPPAAAAPSAQTPPLAPAAGKKSAEPKVAATGKHLLVVGDFASEPQMRAARAKVVKAGMKPALEKVGGRAAPMHRLLVGQYGDRGGAEAALQRVKGAGSAGFLLREGDQYAVYAGSFLEAKRAAQEREKLAAAGVVTAVRVMPVSLPAFRLTAGRFATKEDARQAAATLAKAGLSPRVVTLGAK